MTPPDEGRRRENPRSSPRHRSIWPSVGLPGGGGGKLLMKCSFVIFAIPVQKLTEEGAYIIYHITSFQNDDDVGDGHDDIDIGFLVRLIDEVC